MLPPSLMARSAAERYVAELLSDCEGIATLFDNGLSNAGPCLGVASERSERERIVDTFLSSKKNIVSNSRPKNIAAALFGLPNQNLKPLSLCSAVSQEGKLANNLQQLPSLDLKSQVSPKPDADDMSLGSSLVEACKEPTRRSTYSGDLHKPRESESARLRRVLDPEPRQFDVRGEKEHAKSSLPLSAREAPALVSETSDIEKTPIYRHSRLSGLVLQPSQTGETHTSSCSKPSTRKPDSRRESFGLPRKPPHVVLNESLMSLDHEKKVWDDHISKVHAPQKAGVKFAGEVDEDKFSTCKNNRKSFPPMKSVAVKIRLPRKSMAVKALEAKKEDNTNATNDNIAADLKHDLRDVVLQTVYNSDVSSIAVKRAMEEDAIQGWELVQLSSKLKMSVDDVMLLKTVFDSFDTDQGGTLDTHEFEAAVVRILQLQLHDDTIGDDRIRSMREWCWWGGDTSRGINFKEFVSWFASNGFSEDLLLTEDKRKLRQIAKRYSVPADYVENVKRNFDLCDRDLSGEVEPAEFKDIVYRCMKIPQEFEIPQSRVDAFWMEIDTDGSGKITFNEFFAWWIRYYDSAHFIKDLPFETFYKRIRRVGANHLDPPAYPVADEQYEEEDKDPFANLYCDKSPM